MKKQTVARWRSCKKYWRNLSSFLPLCFRKAQWWRIDFNSASACKNLCWKHCPTFFWVHVCLVKSYCWRRKPSEKMERCWCFVWWCISKQFFFVFVSVNSDSTLLQFLKKCWVRVVWIFTRKQGIQEVDFCREAQKSCLSSKFAFRKCK